ncbi:hypothetical protein AVEN_74106-1 [Araneus ventricosus]|uniref:Transposase Tc1-like domain-containing protein n=1 Tax=Araneus ventricosus TaxID=182803 RepID=A0A4Y2J2U8_ARAVE|nr:hypothetical protein AVEN_74106-1 [Araneus ventricosus]
METIRVRRCAYIRQQVSATVVRSVTASAMAGYQDLSEFERGVIVERWEIASPRNPVKHQIYDRHRCDRKKIMQERDKRRLTRMIKRDRRATLPQTAADFNAGPSTSASVRTIQRNIIDMGFRSRRPTRVPLMTARY